MSKSSDLSAAIVSELNGHTFALPFTAVRTYLPVYNRKTVNDLMVTVVPAAITSEVRTHTTRAKTIQIEIGLQAPVDPEDTASVDPYMDLLEEIDEFLAFHELPAFATAGWMRCETVEGAESGYAPEHLYSVNMFTGLLRITYKMLA